MKRFAILFAGAAAGAFAASAGNMASFGDVDTDASGTISQEEFVTWKTADGEKTEQEAIDKFTMIDADYDGEVSEEEYETAKESWSDKSDKDDMDADAGMDSEY